jgi:serine/threonine-protein kinase
MAALVQTLASAVALWAVLVSVTPRLLTPGDVQPLIMLGTERLPDGRLVSRARFETGPMLAALLAAAVAVGVQGLLRRHWRRAGLEGAGGGGRLPGARALLVTGAVSLATYAAHRLWIAGGGSGAPLAYVPVLGGLIEVTGLFFFWLAVLEARRTARPLAREPELWAGALLTLVPPIVELAAFTQSWNP